MYQITDLINYENNAFSPCIPLFFGIESCTKSHSYGPRKRDYILIHFVLSGTGSVIVGDSKYKIMANQAFIIPANTTCQYMADNINPWRYCWAAFYASPNLLPIKDISYMIGYKNQLEFSSLFKKITGISPTVYRNQYLSYHSDK